jgi:hypothetical protein
MRSHSREDRMLTHGGSVTAVWNML